MLCDIDAATPSPPPLSPPVSETVLGPPVICTMPSLHVARITLRSFELPQSQEWWCNHGVGNHGVGNHRGRKSCLQRSPIPSFSHLVFIFPAFSFSTAIAAATRSWNTLSNNPAYEGEAAGSSTGGIDVKHRVSQIRVERGSADSPCWCSASAVVPLHKQQ